MSSRTPHTPGSAVILALLSSLSLLAGCASSGSTGEAADPGTDPPASAGSSAPDPATDTGGGVEADPASAATGAAVIPVADLEEVSALTRELSKAWVAYVGSVVGGLPDTEQADRLAALHDPDLVQFDTATLGGCVARELQALQRVTGFGAWEHSSWRDWAGQWADGGGQPTEAWTVSVIDNLVGGAPSYDGSVHAEVVIGPGGIVGHRPPAADPESGATADVPGSMTSSTMAS